MNSIFQITDIVGKLIYFLVALSLMLISLSMMAVAVYDVWAAFTDQSRLVVALLDAIGFIVIAMAVFDVSKFLLEEEVFKHRRLGAPQEARVTLTKFLVIISIAVSLEALVFIFDAARKDITTLVYPTFLLVAVALLVVGLGVYQKLSFGSESAKKDKGKSGD
jgi:hypothetical protein